ncbi:hypothetical protein BCR36DRAFT_306632, partial [Piromyces finnis]
IAIDIQTDIDSISLDNLIFFNITSNDPSNLALFGPVDGYCWDNACSISELRGKYVQFNSSIAKIDINISKCVDLSSYIYQDKDNINLKSCYKPLCNPMCSNGKCVNDNICDCSGTNFKGALCDEHYTLKRIKILDYFVFILSIFLILSSIVLIIGVLLFRKNTVIKAGKIYLF